MFSVFFPERFLYLLLEIFSDFSLGYLSKVEFLSEFVPNILSKRFSGCISHFFSRHFSDFSPGFPCIFFPQFFSERFSELSFEQFVTFIGGTTNVTGASSATSATLDNTTWESPLCDEDVTDRTIAGSSSSSSSFLSLFSALELWSSQSSAGHTVGRKDVSYTSPAFKGRERDGERDGEGGRGQRRAGETGAGAEEEGGGRGRGD